MQQEQIEIINALKSVNINSDTALAIAQEYIWYKYISNIIEACMIIFGPPLFIFVTLTAIKNLNK